jgi:hypothetical protein
LFGLSAVTILGHRFKAEDRIDLHRLAALVVLIAMAFGRTSLPSRAIPTTAPGTRFCFISRSKKSSICVASILSRSAQGMFAAITSKLRSFMFFSLDSIIKT